MLLPIQANRAVAAKKMAELMFAASSLSAGACSSNSGDILPPAKDQAVQSGYLPRIRWARIEARSASSDDPLLVAVVRPQPAKTTGSAPALTHRAQRMEHTPSPESHVVHHRIPQYGDAAPVTNAAVLQTFRDIRRELLGVKGYLTRAEKHELIHHQRAVLDVVIRLRDLARADSYEYVDEDRTTGTQAATLLGQLRLAGNRSGQ